MTCCVSHSGTVSEAAVALNAVKWAPAGGWLVIAGLRTTGEPSFPQQLFLSMLKRINVLGGNLIFVDANLDLAKEGKGAYHEAEHQGCSTVCCPLHSTALRRLVQQSLTILLELVLSIVCKLVRMYVSVSDRMYQLMFN